MRTIFRIIVFFCYYLQNAKNYTIIKGSTTPAQHTFQKGTPMTYDAELRFFQNLMKNMDIPFRIFPAHTEEAFKKELDIYSLINPAFSHNDIEEPIRRCCGPNCIYHACDKLLCTYLVFQLPETPEPSYALIGPYTNVHITKKDILETVNRLFLPPVLYPQIEKFYVNLRLVTDEHSLVAILNTFGSVIWKSLDAFTWQDLTSEQIGSLPFIPLDLLSLEPEESASTVKLLENNYQFEHDFLQSVSHGQVHKAEMYLNDYGITRLEPRAADPIRNIKNYSIVLNTLLRKAAEAGGVHPLHINRLSSAYAKKIELLTSPEKAAALHKEMVRKYCLLVKNHSLQSYSPLIKKVITYIEADLTADLSLNAQAQLLNVNASYLSSLFKKEMGMTLTEYVNRSRITYAITLLNSTNLQIQTIAQYCGIPDVNYFTKIFKKFIDKTPMEYRRHITESAKKV